jgi:membrane protein
MTDSPGQISPEAPHHSLPLDERLVLLKNSMVDWIWSPPQDTQNKLLAILQAIFRMQFIVFREMGRDRISLRASALTYTIVLSLVPMLALGTAVLKGLGAGDQMRQAAYRFVDRLEDNPLAIPLSDSADGMAAPSENTAKSPTSSVTDETSPQEKASTASLASHLRRAVDQIFDYVNRTNFATLGAFGIIGLVLAVLSVLGSIEQAMNTIWQADSGRPFGRKLMDYLALMILLPLSINIAFATETTLQSPALLAMLENSFSIAWLGRFLLKALPTLTVVATFTILYRFIPNTKVQFGPAIMGGFFGGIGWLVVQMVYIKLQIGVARYNAIYGSFATLPLLLLWIYIGWLIFLAGAEMAFAAQVWRRYNWHELVLTPITRLALAFEIVSQALVDFHHRKTTDILALALKLKQPVSTVNQLLQELIDGGIIRKVEGELNGYMPAASEKEIQPAEIVELILGSTIPIGRPDNFAYEVLDAARHSLTDKKIVFDPASR